ncbi:MAG: 4-hydroxy-3-methylbut-2-enyl diphosphate reductase [Caldimicrobium sp.]|nr:4-hydroxy-3-methylbut-2-enyl diphosphate reductase [Caldimicrobium sp.]
MVEIKIAKKAGFCMGVRRAVNLVLKALNSGMTPIYTYGPLIHNPQTLELLSSLGVKVIKDVNEELPKGTCIIRAHGVPPKEREALEKRHTIIDGTCPRVLKVQALAKGAKEAQKKVVIIGDKDHAEVKGILGYCEGVGYVVSSFQDIEKLPPLDNYLILSQTTQDEEIFKFLAEEILSRFPGGKVINTICNATEVRQNEVRRLSRECPAIVVIGGKFSANTVRLAQIAQNESRDVYLIEKVEELPLNTLKNYPKVGITAGASTPNWLINEVVDRLRSATNPFYRAFKAFHILAFHEAFAFLFLVLATSLWLTNIPKEILYTLLLFLFFLQLLRKNLYQYLLRDSYSTYYPLKGKTIERHKLLVKNLILGSGFIAFTTGFLLNPWLAIFSLSILAFDLLSMKKPLFVLGDLLLFVGIMGYLFPYWNETFFWLAGYTLISIIWFHLYKELIYLQSDGFLPKNFLILTLGMEEKKGHQILLLGLALLALPFFGLVIHKGDPAFLLFLLLIPLWGVLVYLLKQRPLGQILYLESLILLPQIGAFLLSLALYLLKK